MMLFVSFVAWSRTGGLLGVGHHTSGRGEALSDDTH